MAVLELQSLTKGFGPVAAVDRLAARSNPSIRARRTPLARFSTSRRLYGEGLAYVVVCYNFA